MGLFEEATVFMKIITLKEMTKAIENKVGMEKGKAEKIAGFILDAFGYESRIIDNILKPDERQMFYMLQSEGLLTTSRERSRLHDGREWMTHYWTLKREKIYICAHNNGKNETKNFVKTKFEKKRKNTVYSNLSDEVWLARKILHQGSTGNF